jgi:hypothetical protein
METIYMENNQLHFLIKKNPIPAISFLVNYDDLSYILQLIDFDSQAKGRCSVFFAVFPSGGNGGLLIGD